MWVVVVSVALGACDAGVENRAEDVTLGSLQSPIVDGKITDGYPAVPMLLLGNSGICTGTLVSPRTVITAAHCMVVPSYRISVQFINQFQGEGQRIPATGFDILSGTDLAAVSLEYAPTGVAPIHINEFPLDDLVGASIKLVGFGTTEENNNDAGQKREGDALLSDVTPGGALHTGEIATTNDVQGTCYGDSGGPNLLTIGDTTYLAGVTSRGTDECGAGVDIAIRVDSYTDWIKSFIAEREEGSCEMDGICVNGCEVVDSDCCVADGLCEETCAESGLDWDCEGISIGGILGTDHSSDDLPTVNAGGCSSTGDGNGPVALLMIAFGLAITARRSALAS